MCMYETIQSDTSKAISSPPFLEVVQKEPSAETSRPVRPVHSDGSPMLQPKWNMGNPLVNHL